MNNYRESNITPVQLRLKIKITQFLKLTDFYPHKIQINWRLVGDSFKEQIRLRLIKIRRGLILVGRVSDRPIPV